MMRLFYVLSSLAVVSCAIPFDGTPYAITETSRRWWAEVEDCTGLRAPIEGVNIQVSETLLMERNRIGEFFPPNYITVQAGYEAAPLVLKHEAFHYLLREVEQRRDSNHSDPRWTDCRLTTATFEVNQ